MAKIVVIWISLILALGTAHAQNLYKWVDQDGNVTYQDQPPPGGDADVYAKDPDFAADEGSTAAPVAFFTIPVCDACDLVRNLLDKHDVPYTEKNANDDLRVQDELMELAGQLSVPLLVIGDELFYGYSAQNIRSGLEDAGYSLDGNTRSAGRSGSLTPEQIAEEAARAAEELTSELNDLGGNDSGLLDDLDTAEEIPEDERINVQVGQ